MHFLHNLIILCRNLWLWHGLYRGGLLPEFRHPSRGHKRAVPRTLWHQVSTLPNTEHHRNLPQATLCSRRAFQSKDYIWYGKSLRMLILLFMSNSIHLYSLWKNLKIHLNEWFSRTMYWVRKETEITENSQKLPNVFVGNRKW